MTRLPYLLRESLDDSGKALWDRVAETRGSGVVVDGALIGPFNAWVAAPDVGSQLTELGAVLRFGISIDRRLIELAIITIAAHWRTEFEWWAHSRMALEQGVPEHVVDAISTGHEPALATDEERTVYSVAKGLAMRGQVSSLVYAAAHRHFGDRGMVELVSLCGYYTLVSFTLNAFDIPLPPGAQPNWERE